VAGGEETLMWLLSYIGGNFALILVVFLAVVALGAVAWFAKNWKVAVTAVVILGAGFAYMQIDKNAYQRRVAEETAAEVNALKARIALTNAAAEREAKRAIADAEQISELKRKASETPPNAGECFDAAAADRVRSIR
jgi:glucan phosphoethanolaminetransferase (alkaline phosphatase superfamily)